MNKKFFLSLSLATVSMFGSAADDLPALHVQGNQLVDVQGKSVTLHGVMDTPNRYFNDWRWQSWKPGYGEEDIQPCLDYFEKIFTAITDNSQGAYCDVFRLHLDPCWTNDPDKKSTGENDISAFSETRYRTYLAKLYIKLIEKALNHGLYVVVRPPGVCPQDLKVGDAYQTYLKQVWRIFAQNATIQSLSGQVSIELANEPVRVYLADGSDSQQALRDYFQPVVDEIRQAGFDGIIWVPGSGWQSGYSDYATYPVSDNNFGYAVHCYSGWYASTNDENGLTDTETMYNQFLKQVPVATTQPVIITEIDWSPYKPGTGHQDEHGNWVLSNYGTWSTAKTSGFGKAFKYIHDELGNVSMTLSGTGTYIDIDQYLNTGKVTPAFDGLEEACGKACFDWYKEWKMKQTTTGIRQTSLSSTVLHTYFYNIEGKWVDSPQKGVYIVKEVLSDGKIRSRKVCNGK